MLLMVCMFCFLHDLNCFTGSGLCGSHSSPKCFLGNQNDVDFQPLWLTCFCFLVVGFSTGAGGASGNGNFQTPSKDSRRGLGQRIARG